MNPITPCLGFVANAGNAVEFYIDLFNQVFGNSVEIARTHFSQAEIDIMHNQHGIPLENMPGPAGTVKTIRFRLNGIEMIALNGGDFFGKFHESLSLVVNCKTQAQIDRLHAALSEGGEVQPCGWVKDRFGVSWQILPEIVQSIGEGPDRAAAERMNAALMGMEKLDLERLERAAGL
jgi:predicted 3-demethylubiquinone-9 3-methyltransferase (glyoxalase superfamily)